MAWTTEYWHQDDDIFYGYPIPLAVSVPEVPNKSLLPTKWVFDDAFYGYPHIVSAPEVIDKSQLPTKWVFDDAFYGYPHVFQFPTEIPDKSLDIMYGQIPVQKVYLGTELVWQRGSDINKLIAKI